MERGHINICWYNVENVMGKILTTFQAALWKYSFSVVVFDIWHHILDQREFWQVRPSFAQGNTEFMVVSLLDLWLLLPLHFIGTLVTTSVMSVNSPCAELLYTIWRMRERGGRGDKAVQCFMTSLRDIKATLNPCQPARWIVHCF